MTNQFLPETFLESKSVLEQVEIRSLHVEIEDVHVNANLR